MTLYRVQAVDDNGIIQKRFLYNAEDASEIWEMIDTFEWPGVSEQANWEVDTVESLQE